MPKSLTKKLSYTPHFAIPGKKQKSSMMFAKHKAKHFADKQERFMKIDICDACGAHGAKWYANMRMLICTNCLEDIQNLLDIVDGR